LPLSASSLV